MITEKQWAQISRLVEFKVMTESQLNYLDKWVMGNGSSGELVPRETPEDIIDWLTSMPDFLADEEVSDEDWARITRAMITDDERRQELTERGYIRPGRLDAVIKVGAVIKA